MMKSFHIDVDADDDGLIAVKTDLSFVLNLNKNINNFYAAFCTFCQSENIPIWQITFSTRQINSIGDSLQTFAFI